MNISNLDPKLTLPRVVSDDVAIGRIGAEHFLERGFRSFGYCGLGGHGYSKLRELGFRSALASAGFTCSSAPDGKNLSSWLTQLKKPVAIFCGNDIRARQAAVACAEIRLQIPAEVAILGVDNDEIESARSPVPLSSVAPAFERIGEKAMELLIDLVRGGKPPRQTVLVPPLGIITRLSTDVLAVDDPKVAEALRHIRNHAGDPLHVSDLARMIGLSRRLLEQRFQRALNRSPYAEILRAHVDLAKRLLVESEMTVGEIAGASGFTNQNNLLAVFRKHTGLTPTAYRGQFTRRR